MKTRSQRLPKDVQYCIAKAGPLIRAAGEAASTIQQLSLNPRSPSIRGWLARDLAEVAARSIALMATLNGGALSDGDRDLIDAHTASYLKSP